MIWLGLLAVLLPLSISADADKADVSPNLAPKETYDYAALWQAYPKILTTMAAKYGAIVIKNEKLTLRRNMGMTYNVYRSDSTFSCTTKLKLIMRYDPNFKKLRYVNITSASELHVDLTQNAIMRKAARDPNIAYKYFLNNDTFQGYDENVKYDEKLGLLDDVWGKFIANTKDNISIECGRLTTNANRNKLGNWQVDSTVNKVFDLQLNASHFSMNSAIGKIKIEELEIEDNEPFVRLLLGSNLNVALQSEQNMNVTHSRIFNRYEARVENLDLKESDQITFSVDRSGVSANSPIDEFRVHYNADSKLLDIWDRKEHLIADLESLTVTESEELISIAHDEVSGQLAIICELKTAFGITFTVHKDGCELNSVITSITYHRKNNTFAIKYFSTVYPVIDIEELSKQNFDINEKFPIDNTSASTLNLKRWISKTNNHYITINDYVVELHAGRWFIQIDRLSGRLTNNFGCEVDWTLSGGFSAQCNQFKAGYSTIDKLKVISASGRRSGVRVSVDKHISAQFYNDNPNAMSLLQHMNFHAHGESSHLSMGPASVTVTAVTDQTRS